MSIRDNYLLTLKQTSDLLGLPVKQTSSLAESGTIQSHKTPGGHRRFNYKHVQEYVVSHADDFKEEQTHGPHILTVDDEEPLTFYLKEIIRKRYSDINIHLCSNGFDAGLKAAIYTPEIIFLDLMMPGMNGFDTCKIIRESITEPASKIIILSGYCNDIHEQRAMESGADMCLRKPVDKSEIYQYLDKFLEIPHQVSSVKE